LQDLQRMRMQFALPGSNKTLALISMLTPAGSGDPHLASFTSAPSLRAGCCHVGHVRLFFDALLLFQGTLFDFRRQFNHRQFGTLASSLVGLCKGIASELRGHGICLVDGGDGVHTTKKRTTG